MKRDVWTLVSVTLALMACLSAQNSGEQPYGFPAGTVSDVREGTSTGNAFESGFDLIEEVGGLSGDDPLSRMAEFQRKNMKGKRLYLGAAGLSQNASTSPNWCRMAIQTPALGDRNYRYDPKNPLNKQLYRVKDFDRTGGNSIPGK